MHFLIFSFLLSYLALLPNGGVTAHSLSDFTSFLDPRFGSVPLLESRDLPVGTCNADTPCVNGACCSSNSGLCGYSPAECGAGNCSSNCDAKAECGQYGNAGSQNCPLDVCCSKFGFCGSTSDFCSTGCQEGYGGCGDVDRPSCSSNTIGKRTIGYYESWSNTRTCQSVSPEDLNLNGFTHLNFAFASFDPSTMQITPMDSNAASLYSRFTALKSKYSGLQTWISVGGWSFTDPGPTREAFSNMAASSSNRQAFINGLIKFMDTYGFDGVDMDWEYPAADDRGGVAADTANYVTLVKEMRSAFGSKYGFSMTLPTSYWYLQHFDIANMQSSVDWFNFMTYDLHGTWDAQSAFLGPFIACHTNLTEIDQGLDLLWRAGVKPEKVVLGEAWYGRSFTLKDGSCNTPNGICQFTGGANAGPCSDASGILDYQEIQDIITTNKLTPVHDEKAGVKWITWDTNQWVSYDDDDTFKQKNDLANSRCLGGTMVWAMDQKDQSQDNGLGAANGVTNDQQSDANQMSSDQQASNVACYTSDCGDTCKTGTFEVTQMSGQPGQVSTADRCDSGKYRSLCCTDGTTLGTCEWRGWRGAGLSCMGGCASDETELARNTNHHDSKVDQTCNGGLQSYCCSGFKAAPSKSQLASDAEDAAEEAAEAAAEQAALDLAAKAFCRVAVPALLAPLELLEDLIPIFGEIADIAEIAATPALIQACVKGVEKEGKAEFKVFGKEHTLSFDKPTEKPTTRPAESTHTSASTKSESTCSLNKKRVVDLRTDTRERQIDATQYATTRRTCNGVLYPQACWHYSSVIDKEPNVHSLLTCTNKALRAPRDIPQIWSNGIQGNGQHYGGWITGWMQSANLNCERDEFPPAVIWQGRDGGDAQWLRFLPQTQNGGAGQLFNGICDDVPASHTTNRAKVAAGMQDCRPWESWTSTVVTTFSVLGLDFSGMGVSPDYELANNPCYPLTLINEPGFALMWEDPYYDTNAVAHQYAINNYQYAPAAGVTQGKVSLQGYNKRHFGLDMSVDPEDVVVVDGNSTRKATDQELFESFGLLRCSGKDCKEEQEALGIESALLDLPPKTTLEAVMAATTASASTEATASVTSHPELRMPSSPDLAQVTNTAGIVEELRKER